MPEDAAQLRAKRVKMAVIPLLVIVLLYLTFGRSREETNRPAAIPVTRNPAPQVDVRPTKLPTRLPEKFAGQVTERPWPQRTLAEILNHDPFRLHQPAELVGPLAPSKTEDGEQQAVDAADVEDLVARFSSKTLDLVLHSRLGTSAVIDGQTVREGDVLEGTARIVEIRPDGIVFELLE